MIASTRDLYLLPYFETLYIFNKDIQTSRPCILIHTFKAKRCFPFSGLNSAFLPPNVLLVRYSKRTVRPSGFIFGAYLLYSLR